MSKYLLTIFYVLVCLSGWGQTSKFLFVESTDRQPFYLKEGNRVYSSTSVGYLLKRVSEYDTLECVVGFPRDRWKRMRYRLPMSYRDNYFQWMQVDTGTWAMYDRISGKWIQAEDDKSGSVEISEDALSLDSLAFLLENEKSKHVSVEIETETKALKKQQLKLNNEEGFLMIVMEPDGLETVIIWIPNDERKILKRENGEEQRWSGWIQEEQAREAFEMELRKNTKHQVQ
jgi:hypothetical protein